MIVGERAFIGMLLVFSILVLLQAYLISGFSSVSSPGSFPMFSAVVMVISIMIVLFNTRKMEKPDVENLKDEMLQATKAIFPRVFVIYAGLIILYMILLQPLTFLPSSFGFLLLSIIYLNLRRKESTLLKSFAISAGTLGIIYVVFHYLFRVVLP